MIRPNQDDRPDLSDVGGFWVGPAMEVSSEVDPMLEVTGIIGGKEGIEEAVPGCDGER